MRELLLYLLAVALCHTDMPLPAWLDRIDGLEHAVCEVALSEQWIGPAERLDLYDGCEAYEGCPRIGLREQLVWLRDARDMLAGAPRLEELRAVPCGRWLDDQVAFARGHVAAVAARRKFCTADLRGWYDDWHAEASSLLVFWEQMHLAANDSSGIRYLWRRQALAAVVWQIGSDNLAAGNLPSAAPLWRFRRIP